MKTTNKPKNGPRTETAPQSLDERVGNLQTASTQYRERVQAESAAERAKPPAPYAVGRAALDEAMRILGVGRFGGQADVDAGAETGAIE